MLEYDPFLLFFADPCSPVSEVKRPNADLLRLASGIVELGTRGEKMKKELETWVASCARSNTGADYW